MDVFEVIHSRHSYRDAYRKTPVPREDLITIMKAGLAAPSGCNAQTVSLIAVDDPVVLEQLKDVMVRPLGKTAPAFICVLTQKTATYHGNCYNVQDYAAAVENMLIGVRALGYQSCWVEGYVTDENQVGKKMAEILHVPEGYELVCILPVGIAEHAPVLPKKKSFEERAWFNAFGNISDGSIR